MKVALVIPEMLPFPPVRGGGIEGSIEGMLPYIRDRHEVTIVSITYPGLPVKEKVNGVEHVRFPAKYYWQAIAKYLKLKKEPFDVVHVFNRPRRIAAYKQVAPRIHFTCSLHNEVFAPAMLPDADGAACVKSVDYIIAVSNWLGRTVTGRYPDAQGKVETVYSGVDLDRYRPLWEVKQKRDKLREQMGLTGKKVIVFTGRVLPKKGTHILVDAFKTVLKSHPDALLLIIGSPWYGDNSETAYMKKLREMSEPVKDKIVFTNFVPQAKMPDYYTVGDIFVCPSQWQEPAGRVHFEAMAAGLPIITTNRGGIPEVVTNLHDGIVINKYRNPDSFAQAINDLLSNPAKAQRLAENGRATAEKRFSFAQMAEGYVNIWEKAVAKE